MTAILLSIKPKYADLILSGKKKTELRKRVWSKGKRSINKVYLYASAPIKRIVGYFEIDFIVRENVQSLWLFSKDSCCLSAGEFKKYFTGHTHGTCIVIKKYRKFREGVNPFELDTNFKAPMNFCYLSKKLESKIISKIKEKPLFKPKYLRELRAKLVGETGRNIPDDVWDRIIKDEESRIRDELKKELPKAFWNSMCEIAEKGEVIIEIDGKDLGHAIKERREEMKLKEIEKQEEEKLLERLKGQEDLDAEQILKEIGKAWQETKEHFGKAFEFEDDLKFKICDNGKEFPGKILIKKGRDESN